MDATEDSLFSITQKNFRSHNGIRTIQQDIGKRIQPLAPARMINEIIFKVVNASTAIQALVTLRSTRQL